MFFVSGITGHVGGAAARQLLKQGRTVRTLARDPQKASAWSKQGVEIIKGDLNDPATLAKALDGVEGVFLMLPPVPAPAPGFPETKALIDSYREALRKSAPPRVAALSSIGSEQTSGVGLITQTQLLENALRDLPFPVAFVRAGSFLENYTFALESAPATGYFDTFFAPTNLRVPMVAAEDIGNEVAGLLVTGWAGVKIIELGTPYSADDVARALAEVFSRRIAARSIPRDQWTSVLAAQGIPADGSQAFQEMEDGFNSGRIQFGVPNTEPVAATITPAEFFRQAQSG